MNLKSQTRGRPDPGAAMAGLQYGLSADFDVTVRKIGADGDIVSERTPVRGCPNLITDYGLDYLGTKPLSHGPGSTGDAFTTYLSVGTGNAAPAFTDTALAAKVAHVAVGGVNDNTCAWDTLDPDRIVVTRVFTFGVGAAAGALRELGLHGTAGGTLTTRALFKDAFGDPTVIDVDSDEQLIVTYRIYIKPALTNYVFTTTQNAVEYTVTTRCSEIRTWFNTYLVGTAGRSPLGVIWSGQGRACRLRAFYGTNSALNIVTATPTGTMVDLGEYNAPNYTQGAYTNGTYYRDDSITIPVASGNYNDIGVFVIEGFPFKIQIGISPRLSKTSLDTVKLTIRTSWARGSVD